MASAQFDFGTALPADLRPRLALDIAVAAFHRALDSWSADPGEFDIDTLADRIHAAFAAVPEALTLTPARRATARAGPRLPRRRMNRCARTMVFIAGDGKSGA
ncbi:hypothetical protein [Nocardia jinanensis]|uniref:hypothetical protein n=1 Tax=Nocardia jinanensis TaxID=382504 RepID=UPI0007385602|nr:hypothetical protein [Nocardia jinanensis]